MPGNQPDPHLPPPARILVDLASDSPRLYLGVVPAVFLGHARLSKRTTRRSAKHHLFTADFRNPDSCAPWPPIQNRTSPLDAQASYRRSEQAVEGGFPLVTVPPTP